MLVLTRKTNEQLVIGENIVVTVVEVRPDRVRLGFEAPRECPSIVGKSTTHQAVSCFDTESKPACETLPRFGRDVVGKGLTFRRLPGIFFASGGRTPPPSWKPYRRT